jgi:hypothetical protein
MISFFKEAPGLDRSFFLDSMDDSSGFWGYTKGMDKDTAHRNIGRNI